VKPSEDDIARERMVPLAPGERPLPVTISAALLAAIAIVNLAVAIVLLTKSRVGEAAGGIVFAAIMSAAAVALWRVVYGAVLAFQGLLAVVLLFVSLRLVLAEGVAEALFYVVVMAAAGTLFWFMVKAMARIYLRRPVGRRTDMSRGSRGR
jgi:hypothetical protein